MCIITLSFVICMFVLVYTLSDFHADWLRASISCCQLGSPNAGVLARLLVYFTSILMVMSFFSWVPSRKCSFTYIGERTLYFYLLHGFIIQYIRKTDLLNLTHPAQIIILIPLTIGVVYLLSH